MIYFLGVISVLILFLISVIHFYWAFGGEWGICGVIPTKTNKDKVINPPIIATVFVGLFLVLFALLYAEKLQIISMKFLPIFILNYGVYIIASIFLLRAIGDFKYVGFFKKIKNTQFAKNDTMYFSPLCLFLGIVGMLI
ncbi:hypothetical protein WH52_10290 [Tenacibaculum holothuriorum]|uniref:DUF3995 domain-containing protein n=1 Tax=Tenacibaculum holothuriorum TaxID=1635173 RepID=A0A1Y2PBE7_9FLAO|nr:DUF3995 domain-containing protein [Tenacibaculum holothuriorum]OSY87803.1 hypothetical protein WH52_10290 [Tenacibaculum holothuriorum]